MAADERVPPRMTPDEARQALDDLGLSIDQAARLMRVTTRTMRRYFDGDSDDRETAAVVPGAVEQALRAWLALHERGLPWRPDARPLEGFEPEQLARMNMLKQHVLACVWRVRDAGGPTLPWDIDADLGLARLGTLSLHFYVLPSGGFVPQSYSRQDKAPDLERDRPHLEDGIAAIAQRLQELGLPAEPPPGLTPAEYRDGVYEMWDDQSPPRHKVRIRHEVVAALAGTDNMHTCMRFLRVSQGEIAKIAVREKSEGRYIGLDDAGIELVELDVKALAPAILPRRDRVQVDDDGETRPKPKMRRVLLVGSKHDLPLNIPPILGEE